MLWRSNPRDASEVLQIQICFSRASSVGNSYQAAYVSIVVEVHFWFVSQHALGCSYFFELAAYGVFGLLLCGKLSKERDHCHECYLGTTIFTYVWYFSDASLQSCYNHSQHKGTTAAYCFLCCITFLKNLHVWFIIGASLWSLGIGVVMFNSYFLQW